MKFLAGSVVVPRMCAPLIVSSPRSTAVLTGLYQLVLWVETIRCGIVVRLIIHRPSGSTYTYGYIWLRLIWVALPLASDGSLVLALSFFSCFEVHVRNVSW